jgi:hypothetical protein
MDTSIGPMGMSIGPKAVSISPRVVSIASKGVSIGTMDTSDATPGIRIGVLRGSGKGMCIDKKKGACTQAHPQERCYLLLSGAVAGAGAPASGAVGGTTVGLGRLRSGLIPNSTSLSLPWP